VIPRACVIQRVRSLRRERVCLEEENRRPAGVCIIMAICVFGSVCRKRGEPPIEKRVIAMEGTDCGKACACCQGKTACGETCAGRQ
jgi:hypothetical protein